MQRGTRSQTRSGKEIRTGVQFTALVATVAGGLLVGTGCSNKLETGYEPVRLNSTPAQRRAFYAPPFSPEAVAAPDRDEELANRRFIGQRY